MHFQDKDIHTSGYFSGTFLFLGFCGAIAFWIFEAWIHSAVMSPGELLDNLFRPDLHELWMRLLVAAMFISFGLFAEIHHLRREEIEEALSSSKSHYRALAENARDAIFILDKDYRITYVNEFGASLLGRGGDELPGTSIDEIFGRDSIAHMRPNLEKVAETREPMSVEGRFDVGGRTFWLDTSLVPMTDRFGGFMGIMGISRDITERKRLEEVLREERDRAQKYLDMAGVMFVHLDAEGRVAMINRKGCQILGYEEDEIVGRDWFDEFIPAGSRERVRQVFGGIAGGDVSKLDYHENPVICAGGEEKVIAWHNTVITDDRGRVTGTLSSGEDITERKKSENDLRMRLDELERFRRATVEREFRVKELKDRLRELEGELSGRARSA